MTRKPVEAKVKYGDELQELSDEDLQHILAKRQADRNKAEEEENLRQAVLVSKHVDVLLEFFPKHDSSCRYSDEHPRNIHLDGGYLPCPRCQLLNTKNVRGDTFEHYGTIARIELFNPPSLPTDTQHIRVRSEQDEMQ